MLQRLNPVTLSKQLNSDVTDPAEVACLLSDEKKLRNEKLVKYIFKDENDQKVVVLYSNEPIKDLSLRFKPSSPGNYFLMDFSPTVDKPLNTETEGRKSLNIL